jgi:cell division septation protein DedD
MTIHVCLRTCLRNAGKSAVRRIAVLLVGVVVLSGCGDSGPALLPVRAVAAGVASLAPFFDEDAGLGRDQRNLTSREPHSGLQQGNAPGLYGGTRKRPKICDIDKLERFLTDPENRNKAQVWADIVGVKVGGISDYLDDLTPVLLRHDTLVKNHDYKNGEGVPFDALLEAGIAVLVDEQGLPAVKCSCGNPLRAFDDDPERIDVKFDDRNDEWDGYDESAPVVVKPAPEQLKEIKLVDVQDPGQGISRDVGTAGESDETFDARERRTVPEVAGKSFGEASAALADDGLAVVVEGDEMPPSDAPVTGSSPGAGAKREFGDAVTLTVDWKPTDEPPSDGDTGTGTDSGTTSGGSGSDSGGEDEGSDAGSGGDGRGSDSGSGGTDSGSGSGSGSGSDSGSGSGSDSGSVGSSGGGIPSPSWSTPTPVPTPTPTPTPKPTPTPTPTPEPTTPTSTPTTSSAAPPPPEPTPTEESDPPVDPPVDPTSTDPEPSGDTPSEDPAQPVWI